MPALMRRLISNVSASALALAPLAVGANPLNGQVVGGAATIVGQGTNNVVVDQTTNRAIVNWGSFNIAPGQTTQFVQPNASSVILNRVGGGLGASQIDGVIKANGGVYVVNPDGILFGRSAYINVGSFLGTTHDIANGDFMAGKGNFTISGNPSASIVNQGMITASGGGFAALVAPGVRNDGIITANLGNVALASGNGFTLDLYGDNLITLQPGDAIANKVVDVATGQTLKSLVQNTGALKAAGGKVSLTAVAAKKVLDSVINSSGVIEADTVGARNGLVVFGAATAASKPAGAPTQTVKVSGKIRAAGRKAGTTGGKIQIAGENIQLAGAKLDASGRAGGGTVLIGGVGHSGAGPAIPVASDVAVDAATTIDASATVTGNGGTVVVWSGGLTTFAGAIAARGGVQRGDGELVETSGGAVDFAGIRVDTSAPAGKAGTWLVDPTDLTVDAAAAATIEGNLGTTNVTLQTNGDSTTSGPGNTSSGPGDIIVAAPIAWASANSLTLSAYHDVTIDANISNRGGAAVNLRADNSGIGVGTVSFGSGAIVSTSGAVSIFYNPPGNNSTTVNATSYTTPSNYSGDVTAGGSLTPYMLVNTVFDLQNMQNSPSGDYALGTNIDASATAGWNAGAGFAPIGNSTTGFTGIFNGKGNTISGLVINSSAEYVGLFGIIGSSGSIQNLGINNINLTARGYDGSSGGYAHIGALAGINDGTIATSYATGTVASDSPYGTAPDTGGLVGTNNGQVKQSYASVNLADDSTGGNLYLGGLVGWNQTGTITQSYSTGSVNSPSTSAKVGGLVGYNSGGVTQSYEIGAVSGSSAVGGLAGSNSGTVDSSYWNAQTSGQNASAGGTSLTTAQMQDSSSFQTTFSGWDFQNVWSPPNQAGQGGQAAASYPQPYSLTPVVWVRNGTRTYGAPNADITATPSGGPGVYAFGPPGDTLNVSASYSSVATATSGVGLYPLMSTAPSTATSADGVRYRVLSGSAGTLTITPAAVTVTALGGSSILGSSPSNPGLSATGLQNGQSVSALTGLMNSFGITGTSSVAGSPYTLSVTGTLTNPNYEVIATDNGLWTITPTPVVVPPGLLAYAANPDLASSSPSAQERGCKVGTKPQLGLDAGGSEPHTQAAAASPTLRNIVGEVASAGALQHSIATADLDKALQQLKATIPGAEYVTSLVKRIGSAVIARNQVDALAGAAPNRITVGDEVFANETVRTGEDSNGKFVFTDETNLAMGPRSTVKLDRFVFADEANYSTAAIKLTQGAFRFITGNSQKRAYDIETPTATIGVRGTIVDIKVVKGTTTVALREGNSLVCPRGNRHDCLTLKPGQTVTVTLMKAAFAPPGWTFASTCTGDGGLCGQTSVAQAATASGAQRVALGASGAETPCAP